MVPVFGEVIELRERLIPYLAEQARKTTSTGAALLRPLYLDHAEHLGVWERPLQWMLGDDLLFAPVANEAARSWATYLPSGEWLYAWTGETYASQQTVELPAPLDRIPVFVRAEAWDQMKSIFSTRP